MAQQQARCTNFGECVRADSRETMILPEGADLVCPTCGKQLTAILTKGGGGGGKSPVLAIVGVLGVVGVLIVIGILVKSLSKDTNPGPGKPLSGPGTGNGTQNGGNGNGGGGGGDSAIVLRLHGSNTIGGKLAPELVKAFLESKKNATDVKVEETQPDEKIVRGKVANGEIKVEIQAHGTTTAFEDLYAGKCDIGMASHQIDPEQESLLRSSSAGGVQEDVIALDGLAIIVPKDNPINELNRDQIRQIFSGKVNNWVELPNGAGGHINLFTRDDKSGTWEFFRDAVLGGKPPKGDKLREDAQRLEDSAKLVDAVAADPNGIGFVGLAYVKDSIGVKKLAIHDSGTEPLEPTVMSVKEEKYILSRRLYMYLPKNNPKSLAQEFIRFVNGDEGQVVVKNTGYVDQVPIVVSPSTDPVTPAQIPSDAPPAYRNLYTTANKAFVFFFQTGSAGLDSKAQQDMERLENYIGQNPTKANKIVLVGFTDNVGSPAQNVPLSRQRAESVRDMLRRKGIIPATEGYGQLCPIRNNDTDANKAKNRRVEVWVYKN